jgi:hypothetical protein
MLTVSKQMRGNCKKRLQELVVLSFFLFVFGYVLTSCTSQVQEKKETQSPFQPLPETLVATDEMDDVDFSRFRHDSERHQTVPCLLCHQRNEESPKPRFSSHTPCVGCHTPQFKDNTHPICVICHTEPNSAELKPFPAMTSFKAGFDHTAHFKETNCATCHKPQGGGMDVPNRSDAHVTCFQCHTSDRLAGDRNIGSCSTCHEPGRANRIVDRAENIGFNFDHARHGSLSCNSCHRPRGANEMSAITVAMHSGAANSCATCHNEKRAFGANDFSDCRRCHSEVASAKNFGIRFSHSVHAKTDCATCHKSGGVNFTVPNSERAHQTCFQCHSAMKGGGSFTTGRCFTCHEPGGGKNITASPQTIKGNFSHAKHGFFECDSCHTATGANMSAPAVLMHKAPKSASSCATCHDNQTAFGRLGRKGVFSL